MVCRYVHSHLPNKTQANTGKQAGICNNQRLRQRNKSKQLFARLQIYFPKDKALLEGQLSVLGDAMVGNRTSRFLALPFTQPLSLAIVQKYECLVCKIGQQTKSNADTKSLFIQPQHTRTSMQHTHS